MIEHGSKCVPVIWLTNYFMKNSLFFLFEKGFKGRKTFKNQFV